MVSLRLVAVLSLIVSGVAGVPEQGHGDEPGQYSQTFGCHEAPEDVAPNMADPTSAARFAQRDLDNQNCARQRTYDQATNLELHRRYREQAPSAYIDTLITQLQEADRPTLTAARILPGVRVGDPFRDPALWESAGRGRHETLSFTSSNTGARLVADLWLPPISTPPPHPAVIIAPGSSQRFRQLYRWAAQGLAEEGYMVLTFDVQGQGDSENLSHQNDGRFCSTHGCVSQALGPPIKNELFDHQLADAIRFLFSTPTTPYGMDVPNQEDSAQYNPHHDVLDREKVGVAGHSLGASAATNVGQLDQRIRAIVRWGATGPVRDDVVHAAHAPMLSVESDYGQAGPVPQPLLPIQFTRDIGHEQMKELGIDSMLVSLRASTPHEWTYLVGVPASGAGERVTFHYTLAWFDAYLKGISDLEIRQDATLRLTERVYDGSADQSAIGAGRYGPGSDGELQNIPYTIQDDTVCQHLSYIYKSRYWLKGGGLVSEGLRGSC